MSFQKIPLSSGGGGMVMENGCEVKINERNEGEHEKINVEKGGQRKKKGEEKGK